MFRIPAWSGGPNSCPELCLIQSDKYIQCKVESFSPNICRRVCWNIFPHCTDNTARSWRCGHSSTPPAVCLFCCLPEHSQKGAVCPRYSGAKLPNSAFPFILSASPWILQPLPGR